MPANVLAASNGYANGVFIDKVKSSKNGLTEQESQDWSNVILHNH